MDTKFIALKKWTSCIVSLFYGVILFSGCGVFESNIKTVETLIYGYKVIKDTKNLDEGNQLVYDLDEDNNTSFRIIETNCQTILYDSSRIFVKKRIDAKDSIYEFQVYNISVNNFSSLNKSIVTEKVFISLIDDCN